MTLLLTTMPGGVGVGVGVVVYVIIDPACVAPLCCHPPPPPIPDPPPPCRLITPYPPAPPPPTYPSPYLLSSSLPSPFPRLSLPPLPHHHPMNPNTVRRLYDRPCHPHSGPFRYYNYPNVIIVGIFSYP